MVLVLENVPGGRYSVNHDSDLVSLTKAYSAAASSSPDPDLSMEISHLALGPSHL